MELITKLGIDVKLILAQIVNFVIILIVLKKFAYGPILALLDKRKKMIEKNVEDTRKIEERMVKMEEEKKQVIADAGKKAMEIIEKAKAEGQIEREQALVNAKREISALAERYRAQLKAEESKMLKDVKEEVSTLIVAVCEKILKKDFEKADQKRLEEAIRKEIVSSKLE
ncbi:MAG: F0F1 ATP synthase subunit B [Candidatus Peregrinibacteria bacterium]|nr:F0F1 ATP synthase subunit B [Candidatus Peregrinibacteria bacterium]